MAPTTIPIKQAIHTGIPHMMSNPENNPTKPTTEPIDRSIPPVRITMDCPIAIIAMIDDCTITFLILFTEIKLLPFMAHNTVKIIRIETAPKYNVISDKSNLLVSSLLINLFICFPSM